MKRIFKALNNATYSILTWGELFDPKENNIVLCLTGNPGLCEFYIEFASKIHEQTALPVCVLNHIGHEDLVDTKTLKNQMLIFGLEGQLKQKVDFIQNHINKNCKIHLIGHSIGAWMLLELFDKHEELVNRVSTINLLFPTVQRMAESRNGWFLHNILRKFYKILILLCILFQWLPEQIRDILVSVYLKCSSMPLHIHDRVVKLLNPIVLERVLLLAFEEMNNVVKLNKTAIERIKNKTNVIYSSHDNWAPVEYMDSLKELQPELQMQEVNIDHAFVIKSSETVAMMVVKFINSSKEL